MRTSMKHAMAFVVLAAVFLVSCSSDDDEVQIDLLAGKWQQVYDEGVVEEGYVRYTFTPGVPSTSGDCTMQIYDVFAGDTIIRRGYAVTDDNRRLFLFKSQYGGNPETQEYDIMRISDKGMTWLPVGSDMMLNFRKVR